MIAPRWRKVFRDLTSNRTRTVLVVLSIAVGVFAIGAVTGSRDMIANGLASGYLASNPASANLVTQELFDDDLVLSVQRMRGIADAEARRTLNVKVLKGDVWKDVEFIAVPDYDDTRIATVRPISGAWPPGDHEVVLERQSLDYLGVKVGDTIVARLPGDDKQRQLQVTGEVHNPGICPPFFCQVGNGMISLDTVEWLGESRRFNQLNIVVSEHANDKQHITEVARTVQEKLERGGYTVSGTNIPEPGKHPIADVVNTLIMLLGVLGFFSLLLSGFLVINTISALLTQQTRQIGVMKSIGATSRDILLMYLTTVLLFGLLSLVIAVPLGALGARAFAEYNASLFNFSITSYEITPLALALQIVAGLIVPLLTAIIPVWLGTRITIREAIGGYGLGRGRFGSSWLDRVLERVRGLSRPLLISLRNTFRRKGRLTLTLLTLTLSGTMFIAVLSVRASVALTLEDIFNYYNNDIFIIAGKSYRTQVLERARTIPGVADLEGWSLYTTRRLRADDSESNVINVISLPPKTRVFNPDIIRGRWLLPDDENAIVVNSALLKEEPDIVVGQEITIKIEGRELTWRVVGVMRMLLDQPGAYVSQRYLGHAINAVDQANWVNVLLTDHSAEAQIRVARALEAHFDREGLEMTRILTAAENSAQAQSQFDIIIGLMLIMAVLLAIVGGLGLMGTMSINVLERTREIGVMRAIGASDGAILRIIMSEGLLVGVLSWGLGALIAIPLSQVMSNAVGIAFVQEPFSYTFSTAAVVVWLVIILGLATLASVLPAWSAVRLTVRDVLAYE